MLVKGGRRKYKKQKLAGSRQMSFVFFFFCCCVSALPLSQGTSTAVLLISLGLQENLAKGILTQGNFTFPFNKFVKPLGVKKKKN